MTGVQTCALPILLAGVCLGLLAYKPQLALVPACVFAVGCVWGPETGIPRDVGTTRVGSCKVVLGGVIAVVAQFLAAWFWYGAGPLIAYAHVLRRIGSAAEILEPRPYLMHSLRAFWELLLGRGEAAFVLYALTAGLMIALAIACWRKPVAIEQRFAVMLLATVLVAPANPLQDVHQYGEQHDRRDERELEMLERAAHLGRIEEHHHSGDAGEPDDAGQHSAERDRHSSPRGFRRGAGVPRQRQTTAPSLSSAASSGSCSFASVRARSARTCSSTPVAPSRYVSSAGGEPSSSESESVTDGSLGG